MRQWTLRFDTRSRKNSGKPRQISVVPYRMLPIVSIEEWRARRLLGRLQRLERERPLTFELLEKWVEHACDRLERAQ